jgi:energy-coupling factor transporter ATP-binding protein EcfA2
MMNACHKCGAYRVDKIVDHTGPFAVCPECGHRHPFKQLPLLTVSGASGSGKSTICQSLAGTMEEAVILDADILWRDHFNHPENDYREFMELWLRMCKNISQAGKPVVLFGAGTGVPMNIEPCVERRYFSQVHYLALVCDNEILERRLEARPAWRKNHDPRALISEIEFNNWFMEESRRLEWKVELVDTTNHPVEGTTNRVRDWILETLGVGGMARREP